jgi:perosamine synthetase
MVLCSDPALAEKMRLLRNQAFAQPRFVHREIGFNYRITNVQAAIGLAQTEKVEQKVERKREIARWYAEAFAGVEDVELPWEAPGAKNVYWMYGVKLGDSFRRGRDGVMAAMKEKGVETRAFFCPMHSQPVFVGDDPRFPETSGEYPVSDDLWKRGLYLPSGLGLTRAQVEEVAGKLAECRD